MSKRSDLLLACMLGNRWRASASTTGASCAASSPTPTSAQSRTHLETIWFSIKNQGGASVHTVQVQVRAAGGTVWATVEHLVLSTTTSNVNISNFAFASPKLGQSLTVAMNTALASCGYALNASGWIEDTNG